jgi:hypothetical protein
MEVNRIASGTIGSISTTPSKPAPGGAGPGSPTTPSRDLAAGGGLKALRMLKTATTSTFEMDQLVDRDIDGMWFAGKINRIRVDGTYDVEYMDDGNTEEKIPEDELRATPSSSDQ